MQPDAVLAGGSERRRRSPARPSGTASACSPRCSSRCSGAAEIHLIDVWDPGRVLAGDARRRAARPARVRRSSSRACSTIPTSTPSATSPLMPFIGLGGSAVPAAVGERCAALGIEIARSFGIDRAPVDHRLLRPTRRTTSASTPTASRCPASRSGSSTTTATTSSSASRARSGAAGPTCFVGYTDRRRDRGRVQRPTAGS